MNVPGGIVQRLVTEPDIHLEYLSIDDEKQPKWTRAREEAFFFARNTDARTRAKSLRKQFDDCGIMAVPIYDTEGDEDPLAVTSPFPPTLEQACFIPQAPAAPTVRRHPRARTLQISGTQAAAIAAAFLFL